MQSQIQVINDNLGLASGQRNQNGQINDLQNQDISGLKNQDVMVQGDISMLKNQDVVIEGAIDQ